MNDDLKKLGQMRPPEPSQAARARALSLARAAYDEAGNNAQATQGNAGGRRRSSIINRLWSPVMNRKFLAGSALATLLVVPAAAFLTLELTRRGLPVATGEQQVEPATGLQSQQADAKKMAPAKPLAESTSETLAGRSKPAAEPSGTLADQVAEKLAVEREARRNRDRFTSVDTNPVKSVATDPVSTFSADVDTASYSLVRRSLMAGQMPDRDSVRVEELINYFPYDWPGPDSKDAPFKATVTVLPTPWNTQTRLMHVGIKGYDVPPATAPRANLVFLIDVSGSMDEPDKLPLLKSAFRLLVEKLKPEDTVSIVTYAGNAGTVLAPTAISDKVKILTAIDTLQPGGSTAGAQGLRRPMIWRSRLSSRVASTGSCWPPTAISMSGRRAMRR